MKPTTKLDLDTYYDTYYDKSIVRMSEKNLGQIANVLEQAIDRIVELENKLEHVHEVEAGDFLTGEPLISGENNEGREIWKPL